MHQDIPETQDQDTGHPSAAVRQGYRHDRYPQQREFRSFHCFVLTYRFYQNDATPP